MTLAFVVQRYGLEINGGAELHCRWVAEHMARHWDVEVLTTRAHDYITWADHYPDGERRSTASASGGSPSPRPRESRKVRPAPELHPRERARGARTSWPGSRRKGRHPPSSSPTSATMTRTTITFIFFSYRY